MEDVQGPDVARALREGWRRDFDGRFTKEGGLPCSLAGVIETWHWENPGDELRG